MSNSVIALFLFLLASKAFCAAGKAVQDEANKLSTEELQKICFVTAFSSNHYHSALRFIATVHKFYPCNELFIYDLGLKKKERSSLEAFSFIHMLHLNMTGPYFPNRACAFKPLMMLDFIDRYYSHGTCQYFFYGDASVFIRKRFDRKVMGEVQKNGLVAQLPMRHYQISYTHPKMYPFFGFNHTKMYEDSLPGARKSILRQVQAGLLFVDAGNETMRDTFFTEWANCAKNYDCLIPDNIVIAKEGSFKKSTKASLTVKGYGTPVFRAHRDDQSAFTFLIAKYFNYSKHSSRRVFLDPYTWVYHQQQGQISAIAKLCANNECCSLTSTKTILGMVEANNKTKFA